MNFIETMVTNKKLCALSKLDLCSISVKTREKKGTKRRGKEPAGMSIDLFQ